LIFTALAVVLVVVMELRVHRKVLTATHRICVDRHSAGTAVCDGVVVQCNRIRVLIVMLPVVVAKFRTEILPELNGAAEGPIERDIAASCVKRPAAIVMSPYLRCGWP
jgi:hypothetical protein